LETVHFILKFNDGIIVSLFKVFRSRVAQSV